MKSFETELDGLVTRYALSGRASEQLRGLVGVLEQPLAPTSVHDPERVLRTHIADSLSALQLASVRSAKAIVDIGAGAGLPGLPLAIALRESDLRVVESQRRKCAFVEMTCAELGIGNVRVVCKRAEEWRDGIAVHDLALARALAPQAVVLEYAAPLLGVGGTLIDWRGRREQGEERAAARAAVDLGMELREVHWVEPYAGARDHHLHEFVKVAETPQRFPRRAGVARKRPLGC